MTAPACCYCQAVEDNENDVELRPYGPDAAWICYDCAIKPEHAEETKRQFMLQLNGAANADRVGVVVIGEANGPRPLNGDKQ